MSAVKAYIDCLIGGLEDHSCVGLVYGDIIFGDGGSCDYQSKPIDTLKFVVDNSHRPFLGYKKGQNSSVVPLGVELICLVALVKCIKSARDFHGAKSSSTNFRIMECSDALEVFETFSKAIKLVLSGRYRETLLSVFQTLVCDRSDIILSSESKLEFLRDDTAPERTRSTSCIDLWIFDENGDFGRHAAVSDARRVLVKACTSELDYNKGQRNLDLETLKSTLRPIEGEIGR